MNNFNMMLLGAGWYFLFGPGAKKPRRRRKGLRRFKSYRRYSSWRMRRKNIKRFKRYSRRARRGYNALRPRY